MSNRLDSPVSPIAAEESVVVEKRFSTTDVVSRYKKYLGVDVSEDLVGVDEILLCRGRESNLRFFWPPTLAGDGSFYAKLMKNPHYYLEDKWEYGAAIDELSATQRVLEIGCGKGDFLARLREAGHDATGLEINDEAIRLGVQAGLDVRKGVIEDFALACNSPYDAVCAFQVLEHVMTPSTFIEAALACLREGGLLILAVPNGDGVFASLDVALDMPPHHMLRWNAAAFQYLTKRFPVVLHDVRHEPMSRLHLGMLATACFNHLSLPQAGPGSFRRKAVATLAAKYWQRYFGEVHMAGHTLFVVYRKVTRRTNPASGAAFAW
jgi:SAM-dependent methyltransferase